MAPVVTKLTLFVINAPGYQCSALHSQYRITHYRPVKGAEEGGGKGGRGRGAHPLNSMRFDGLPFNALPTLYRTPLTFFFLCRGKGCAMLGALRELSPSLSWSSTRSLSRAVT
jgi:hypothetical protein